MITTEISEVVSVALGMLEPPAFNSGAILKESLQNDFG